MERVEFKKIKNVKVKNKLLKSLKFLTLFTFLFIVLFTLLNFLFANFKKKNNVVFADYSVWQQQNCEIDLSCLKTPDLDNGTFDSSIAAANNDNFNGLVCLKVSFGDSNNNFFETLSVREEAKKYICNGESLDLDKLEKFLRYSYEKLIEPQFSLPFCFSNFNEILNKIMVAVLVESENAQMVSIPNSGEIKLKGAKNGVKLDKNAQIFNIFNNLIENNTTFNLNLITENPQILDKDLSFLMSQKAHFKTSYANSSLERKSNIKRALSNFDGLVLNPGEVLSFNELTGVRNEENGYLGAKIIVNGEFVDGLGGGVCQASTTVYNASLLANLEIVEAHPHSLSVSYVAPSFDAMVNFGSSDLKIKNNQEFPVIFATKCDNESCEVNIYGIKNEFEIVRRSEKIEEIEPESLKFVDYEDGMKILDNNFLRYPKKGLLSESYLDFYQNGNLIFTKKLRSDKYNAVGGIVVKTIAEPAEN